MLYQILSIENIPHFRNRRRSYFLRPLAGGTGLISINLYMSCNSYHTAPHICWTVIHCWMKLILGNMYCMIHICMTWLSSFLKKDTNYFMKKVSKSFLFVFEKSLEFFPYLDWAQRWTWSLTSAGLMTRFIVYK